MHVKGCFRGFLVGAVLVMGSLPVGATTYYVSTCGNDDWSGLSEECVSPDGPKLRIQFALMAAGNGDTIIVAPGVHQGAVVFNGVDVTLRSQDPNDWSVVAATVIDRDYYTTSAAVTFSGAETAACVLAGFTITHARGYEGGGIYGNDCQATISRCIIEDNERQYGGGLHRCQGLVERCIIRGNSAVSGGGMAGCGGPIVNCLITENSAEEYGGGLANCDGAISNCTVVFNAAYAGATVAGQALYGCDGSVTNCILWGSNSWWQLVDCTAMTTYCCLPGATGVNGNIGDNPLFMATANGTCGLRSDSPCIDTGDPGYAGQAGAWDIEGQPRVRGLRVDMGSNEAACDYVRLVNPVGGELWAGGSEHEVQWQDCGLTGSVDVYYSVNGGADWVLIAAEQPSNSGADWSVPGGVDSQACVVKAVWHEDPNGMDTYPSGTFSIVPYVGGEAVASLWPSLGGGPLRQGLSSEAGPEWGCLKWQYGTGGQVQTGVAIGAQGRVHVACEDGTLYTLDPNGDLVWSFAAGEGLSGPPSVGADGTVYVGSADGKVYAVDTAGQLRWTHTTGGWVYASAAVDGEGRVFVGSTDGRVYALGADGSDLWEFAVEVNGQLRAPIMAAPAVGLDGKVYVGPLYEPTLYALEGATGAVAWEHDFRIVPYPAEPERGSFGGSFAAAPVVGPDGNIYVSLVRDTASEDTNLYALDPDTGVVAWASELI